MNLKNLTTETRNQATMHIDSASTTEILRLINDEDKHVASEVEKVIPDIAEVVDLVVNVFKSGGRLIYIGAGTSGRLGILDAAECPPTFGTNQELVQGLIAGGQKAILKAVEGAEDNRNAGADDLKTIKFSDKDILIGITSSGRTPYVLGAIEYANSIGAVTVGIDNNTGSELSKLARYSISVVVGPEVITGSTRMKAGTSQKLILNMITTAAMIRCGKVYENLMVDVQPTNDKLMERCKSIVMDATGVEENEAEACLIETNYNCKLSIFMILTGLDKDRADEILNQNEGYIRQALDYVQNNKNK